MSAVRPFFTSWYVSGNRNPSAVPALRGRNGGSRYRPLSASDAKVFAESPVWPATTLEMLRSPG